MKIPRTLIGFQNATEAKDSAFFKALETIWEKLAIAVNGKISFGDGNHTQPDNIDGAWISVVTPVAPNTNFTINHNLNRIPSGYMVMQKSAACDVYTGTIASTATQLTLKETVGNITLLLFII